MSDNSMEETMRKVVQFARGTIESCWEDGGHTEEQQAILDHAKAMGLMHWRKPTASELADDEWWGHEFDIGPNDEAVGELTPEFIALIIGSRAAPGATP